MQKKNLQKKKKWHIKIGDTVTVISGSFKNTNGEVIKINPNNGTLIIKGINLKVNYIKKTNKSRKAPRSKDDRIGLLKKIEGPIHHSNVKLNLIDIL